MTPRQQVATVLVIGVMVLAFLVAIVVIRFALPPEPYGCCLSVGVPTPVDR